MRIFNTVIGSFDIIGDEINHHKSHSKIYEMVVFQDLGYRINLNVASIISIPKENQVYRKSRIRFPGLLSDRSLKKCGTRFESAVLYASQQFQNPQKAAESLLLFLLSL